MQVEKLDITLLFNIDKEEDAFLFNYLCEVIDSERAFLLKTSLFDTLLKTNKDKVRILEAFRERPKIKRKDPLPEPEKIIIEKQAPEKIVKPIEKVIVTPVKKEKDILIIKDEPSDDIEEGGAFDKKVSIKDIDLNFDSISTDGTVKKGDKTPDEMLDLFWEEINNGGFK